MEEKKRRLPCIDTGDPKRFSSAMSNDSVTVTSSQSWFGRIGSAIAGVLIGVGLFIGAFPLLAWNEGRAIKRAKTLDYGAKSVVAVPASPVEASHEGKLVYVTGDTAASGPVVDSQFGLSLSAIKLQRNVEMYQWDEEKKSETKKKLGGGEETVTTYSYSKKWSSSLIDSSDFQKPDGHGNPAKMPVPAKTFSAPNISVGDFKLPPSLIDKIDNFESLPITEENKIPTGFSAPVKVVDQGFYIGKNPEEPVVGDAKVSFESAPAGPVSIIARQTQKTFEPFVVQKLGSIELLQDGTVSAEGMFAAEQQSNVIITWILRVVGFFMMFFGLMLVAKPLAVVAGVIPLLEDLIGAGIGIFALIISLPLTLGTIAVAWLAYRPMIGLPLLFASLVVIFWGIKILRRRGSPPKLPVGA